MTNVKISRPKAGLGLSSAINREQLTRRDSTKAKPAKTRTVHSTRTERPKPADRKA